MLPEDGEADRNGRCGSGLPPRPPAAGSRRRSRISPAALRVNVIARHSSGAAPWRATRCAMRWVRVRVLPEPGPATMSSGPEAISAARRWSASSPDRASTDPTTGTVAAASPAREAGAVGARCEGEANVEGGTAMPSAGLRGGRSTTATSSPGDSARDGAGSRLPDRGAAVSSPKRDAPRVSPRSSPSSKRRIVPYTPSYPASRTTSWRRRRDTASATRDEAAGRMSSTGTVLRSGSSGPSRPRRLS